jgi:myo-inositol 2-dehydrogenase/D-chiro-inositol 1-dehydrogenase
MLNIGIIGAGRIGKVHAEGIMKHGAGARVLAIADPAMTQETAVWAKSLGIRDVGKDYRTILSNPEIGAVLICSSTDTHYALSLEALDAGKHVFCEKPVDTDVKRIREVAEKVAKTGLKYQVGFNRRFDHNFAALRRAVQEGQVGDVHIVRVTSRDPAAPPPEYAARSGGMFLDMTIHDFDMVRYLSLSDVVEVFASAAVLVDPAIGRAGDVDTAVITLRLKNGALAVIDNSRRAAYGYDQRAEVFGSKGSAHTGNDTPSTMVLSGADGITSEKPLYFFLERYMQSFVDEMKAFFAAVETGEDTPVTVHDGLRPVLIALAAQRSMRENRPVKIEEIG